MGQANDIQLMANRQARSTTGCYESTNTGALVAEAGLRSPPHFWTTDSGASP